ncbi:chemotaxis protein CheD [Xylophilus rhododendri]|uniref:Probable chemoreceptor glutamine deamidase CheD n=2 Tax=Xylophilus rhododendri TaxID=2697032 RepID=A0A857JEQ8_9BURK|nr:chemotaxis protein CheD [Xylophilus rhododendri]
MPYSHAAQAGPCELLLQPGDYFVGGGGCRVRTLLGSCVSIVLWDPLRRIGAMSHFLLARRPAGCRQPSARYADDALALMATRLGALGVDLRRCEARIFGGADMFGRPPRAGLPRIGLENGECARQLLSERGIAVHGEHLFGSAYRVIVFEPGSGAVWLRHGGAGLVH